MGGLTSASISVHNSYSVWCLNNFHSLGCYIAHPQLHRYFSDFHPAVSWLIENKVPTILIGASEPDHSWRQDEALLRALGAELVVGKRLNPYPMCLPDNTVIKK